jgi:hypothetical protein
MSQMRFFFDILSSENIIYDYRGLDFGGSDGAIDFAQEKRQLLKNSLSREWAGWSIQVCNAEGARVCCLLIDGDDFSGEDTQISLVRH